MKSLKIKVKSTRLVLFVLGLITLTGILLTGFDKVHWLLYLPTVFMLLGGITGYCPGAMFSIWLFKEQDEPA